MFRKYTFSAEGALSTSKAIEVSKTYTQLLTSDFHTPDGKIARQLYMWSLFTLHYLFFSRWKEGLRAGGWGGWLKLHRDTQCVSCTVVLGLNGKQATNYRRWSE